ncbi:MAG: hypothetical protein COT84_00290 [Chlamydiae bacterium CG10_big_fil_rev_8_21_14_0_10_35_9]|nr:MAG: hypothetical protein COT84_00290 [Chlamydiae bacterium CG10_big_fil_rev_8_21_14_0_10_35_9]
MKDYLVIAYYYIASLEDPHKHVSLHQKFVKNKDIKGRVYISSEGLNGQLSAHVKDADAYFEWLSENYPNISFKIDPSSEHAFCKMTIKFREQLVAFDKKVNLQKRGQHISPEKWDEMLSNMDEDTVLIDVRNDYESEVGHFEKAELPKCNTFREFPKYTEELKKRKNPEKTKVMMYCTGGIRCEYYSAYLIEEGFKDIYQLDGGVINYGHKMGSKHWKGQLFVFDDRLVVPISSEDPETISHCSFCQKKTSTYYNCANMDCNELFLACPDCVKEHKGCCEEKCLSGRIRQFDDTLHPKPFRKLPFEEKQALQRKTQN